MFGWHVPAPDQAMLISGGKSRGDNRLPFRIVTGHGAFVVPVFRRVSYLTLSLMEAVIEEACVTQQGIGLAVKGVIAFKVGSDHASIAAAAQRFLADQDRMSVLTGQIFAGHLRSIVGSMTVEDIIRERQKLAEQVLSASKLEMANLGLVVDSLQIQSIDDRGSGYINSLAAPHQATVQQAAKIAQAQADQLAAEAQQLSVQNQAEYARATAVKQAEYQSQIDQAQATAEQAGPLAAAKAQQAVLEEQAKVAAKNAELREAELVAEVVKPAEAEAERIRTLAQAEADRTKMSAEASAAEGRIALDQAIIAQLPQMMKAAADGLANANLTILNGTDGLNDAVAQLAAQGSTILQTVMTGLASSSGSGSGSGPAALAPGSGASTNGTTANENGQATPHA
ncbi:SPFH domain-containing protein [Nocardioides sp. BP30]|uniref:SPFH domain-containing protein n=1 Tax=Nocardioides sp. BP30 TaxID=3036374 RepID=UPI00246905A8|nr:flotillin family protein [Nocardioides sp. BP30]WGL51362.1 SPFH domain-containing protein [Nocardioides sp. BP30]